MMPETSYEAVFSNEKLKNIFPENRSDQFFEALFGDAAEGAYDISLEYKDGNNDRLKFNILLKQRPGKCLACNLTYGLPKVFSRHPVIDIKGVVENVNDCLEDGLKCGEWTLGRTLEISRDVHIVPLSIALILA